MTINKKLLCLKGLLIMILFSCQTKTKVSYEKYENLNKRERKAVDDYLTDAKKLVPKKDDEIILMFQYRCFFDKNLKLNNGYKADFPQFPNKNHYGQRFANFDKKFGNVDIELSDGKHFQIQQKKGFDYIGVCYYEEEDKWYINYFNYLRMIVME